MDPKLSKLAESAVVLTLSIAAMYCIGWAFVDSYLFQLGIPYDAMNITSDQYLRSGAFPVILVVAGVVLSLSKGRHKPVTIKESFAVNGHWFVLVTIVSLLFYSTSRNARAFAIFMFMIFYLGLLVFVLSKSSLGYHWFVASLYKKLFILLFVFLSLLITAGALGQFVARLVITGKGFGGEKKIKIEPKDPNLVQFKDKEFILVMFRDDLYYLIDPSVLEERPKILVIPKDEIKYATIYRAITP